MKRKLLLLTRFRIFDMAINIVQTINYSCNYIKNSKKLNVYLPV